MTLYAEANLMCFWDAVCVWWGVGGGCHIQLTFLAVMFVLMQHEAVTALTDVRAHGVDALVLAASVVLAALVFVCWGEKPATRHFRENIGAGEGKKRR